MSDIIEFDLDEAKVIKATGVESFAQTRSGEQNIVSIISLKKIYPAVFAKKAADKGSPLTDEEKAAYIAKIDEKLAEKTGKTVEQLTEVDKLDLSKPSFSASFVHYRKDVGTIRCLSKYDGSTLIKAEECCNQLGDSEQKIGMIVVIYPMEDGHIDLELVNRRKQVQFCAWVMSGKRFKKVKSVLDDAKNDNRGEVVDLRVTLEGDPQYQKQVVQYAGTATWARDNFDPEVRRWILDQGLRAQKHLESKMGYKIKLNELMEKLNGSAQVAGHNYSGNQLSSGNSEASKLLKVSYDNILG